MLLGHLVIPRPRPVDGGPHCSLLCSGAGSGFVIPLPVVPLCPCRLPHYDLLLVRFDSVLLEGILHDIVHGIFMSNCLLSRIVLISFLFEVLIRRI